MCMFELVCASVSACLITRKGYIVVLQISLSSLALTSPHMMAALVFGISHWAADCLIAKVDGLGKFDLI